MKAAIAYNRNRQNVINFLGSPNREKTGLQTIKRISDALKKGGQQVASIEADKARSIVSKILCPRSSKENDPEWCSTPPTASKDKPGTPRSSVNTAFPLRQDGL